MCGSRGVLVFADRCSCLSFLGWESKGGIVAPKRTSVTFILSWPASAVSVFITSAYLAVMEAPTGICHVDKLSPVTKAPSMVALSGKFFTH